MIKLPRSKAALKARQDALKQNKALLLGQVSVLTQMVQRAELIERRADDAIKAAQAHKVKVVEELRLAPASIAALRQTIFEIEHELTILDKADEIQRAQELLKELNMAVNYIEKQ